MTKIDNNTVARVHYTGTLPDTGEIFDSSVEENSGIPCWTQTNDPGFERELMGAAGKRWNLRYLQKTHMAPQPRCGPTSSKDMFGGITPEIGMTLMSDLGPFRVTEINGDLITADFNHALAGKSLTFNVEVVEVREATAEEISHGHAHGRAEYNIEARK